MKCPDCENGIIVGYFARMADGSCKPRVEIPCPRCKGECEVPDEMTQWMADGERLRAERLRLGFGLRAAAFAIGVLPSDLSYAEQGLNGHPAAPMMEKLKALTDSEVSNG